MENEKNIPVVDYEALEKENIELKSQLKTIIESVPGYLYQKDINGVYTKANDDTLKILHLKSEREIIGKTDYDLFPKSEADQFRKADLEVIKTGQQIIVEEHDVSRHGKILTQLSIKKPLRNKNGKIIGIIGNTIDITNLKDSQDKFKKSEENKFYKIIDAVSASIYWKNKDCEYLGCNKYMLKMAGIESLSDLIGKSDYDMPWRGIADKLLAIDQDVIFNKKTVEIEEVPTLGNNQVRVFYTTKTPLLNDDGEVIGLIGVSVDITDLKNTQSKLKIAEERLAGMTSIGANVAHELRTPLTAVGMGVSGIKKYLPALIDGYTKAKNHSLNVDPIRPDHYEILATVLDNIEAETNYANIIINIILMNVKQNLVCKDNFQTLSINNCVEEAIQRYPFKENELELVNWNHENNFLFYSDKVIIVHILFNLLKNSLYFIEAEGKGTIKIWCKEGEDYNMLYFKDTAKGIPKDAIPRLFEKFYSTTPNGTGLGLVFCKNMMESMGGNITCESKYGEYVIFILNFPKITETIGKK
jgi:PAS domain S-box-containing protein